MDAGGLAQMSYNSFPNNGALGVPGSGFASRGKGAHIKRLSVQPPALNTTGQVDPGTGPTTPRTSRSHLLAGLRTAARSHPAPPSAPAVQSTHGAGLGDSRYAEQQYRPNPRAVPQTATGSSFPQHQTNRLSMNQGRQMYALPEQVLAPPALQMSPEQSEEIIDPNLYAELVATNLYLAQQQQRLQQQLMSVTAAAQQYQGVGPNGQGGIMPQQFPGQSTGYLGQPMSMNNSQSVIAPVPGAQGWYTVYDPMTGQQSYFLDNNAQSAPRMPSPPNQQRHSASPPHPETPRLEVSPPPPSNSAPFNFQRAVSPPKSTSPAEMSPSLPPPSANAFRRGHKKTTSMANSINVDGTVMSDGLKSTASKLTGIPATPMTGTFGPGQARSGEHPIRQPRAPPPMEELLAKPTAKHEGSKNFASRQRRNAVSNLVRAGLERRTGRHTGSAGSTTPASEGEINFQVDDETGSMGSGTLSGKPSIGSLRAAANGAIGSERKEMKERSQERGSTGSLYTVRSVSSDDGAIGSNIVEVKIEAPKLETPEEYRKTPMLVLTSAEKRKSSMF